MASRNILMGLMVIPGVLVAGIAARQAGGNESSDAVTIQTPEPDFRVVEQFGDKHTAQSSTIRRVTTGADDSVTVLIGQPAAAYEVLEVFSPFRLVVDVYGAAIASKIVEPKASGKVVDRVRVAQHKDKVRIVLDCAGGKRPEYRVEKTASGLRIAFVKEPMVEKSDRVTSSATPPVEIAQPNVTQKPAAKAVTTMRVAAPPKPIEARSAQTSVSPSSEVRDAHSAPSTNRVAADSTAALEDLDRGADFSYAPDEVAGYSVQNPALAPEDVGGSRRQEFQGRRISLDFKDADIHNILRLISEVAKINIITSDDVKGKITITLRNVPWDQALDIILKTKKLGKVQHDNIIRIAPIEEITKEQELYQKAAEIKRVLEPLRVRIISVNYANAGDIETQVKDLLSERGNVTIDKRTNVLIVRDILENLTKAEALVHSLDTETPQVLIEARVVEANTQFLREMGVQWGGDLNFSAASGNATGLAFPNTIAVRGGADDSKTNVTTSGTSNPGSFAINLPAAVGAGSGGALGFILGSANGAAHLNLRLSALENKGAVKIISAPKITTIDNHKALIGQGTSIPISVVSAAGVNTVFVEAKLQLEVTPHITQEGSIVMLIKVTKNEPDFSRLGAQGDPTILKKEAETQVMVHDGDTTVIGGIYTRKTSDTYNGVPFLSRIPILGFLFRHTSYDDERTELLIFITPRVVNRLQATIIQK
jgi:type IV pilus assembly protein PilQ